MKTTKKKPTKPSLKCRLYLSLFHYGVAVYTDDILKPAKLEEAGCFFPARGIELLRLLVELAKEGKVVIWRDEGKFGFLPAKVWERELANEKCLALKMELEASKVTVTNGTLGLVLSAALAPALSHSKPSNYGKITPKGECDENCKGRNNPSW